MAELIEDGDELVVRLTGAEKAEAVHGEVRVPRSAVTAVEVVDDAIHHVHGVRVGTGIPGRTAIGTFSTRGARVFAVVHHNTPRAVLVSLSGTTFDELVVGCADPEGVAASLRPTT